MTTFAIGDLQGCYDELRQLLDHVRFDPSADRLWLTGDLVNRGPKSAECLRFVKSLGDRAITVLGNHDLHLLAVAHDEKQRKKRDTIDDVLRAKDRDELLDWLREQRLAHHDEKFGLLIHAGVLPEWDLAKVLALAREGESMLRSRDADEFLREKMYGDEPSKWRESLKGWDRLRIVINAFTRMRYLTDDGAISMEFKGEPGDQPAGLHPWFAMPDRKTEGVEILFGHWSMLGRVRWPEHRVHGLDTGAVWGGKLTALRLDDGKLFGVKSKSYSKVS
jgi:bis(5'-nucleosyl)-tetraphosphatase (symmetrical)